MGVLLLLFALWLSWKLFSVIHKYVGTFTDRAMGLATSMVGQVGGKGLIMGMNKAGDLARKMDQKIGAKSLRDSIKKKTAEGTEKLKTHTKDKASELKDKTKEGTAKFAKDVASKAGGQLNLAKDKTKDKIKNLFGKKDEEENDDLQTKLKNLSQDEQIEKLKEDYSPEELEKGMNKISSELDELGDQANDTSHHLYNELKQICGDPIKSTQNKDIFTHPVTGKEVSINKTKLMEGDYEDTQKEASKIKNFLGSNPNLSEKELLLLNEIRFLADTIAERNKKEEEYNQLKSIKDVIDLKDENDKLKKELRDESVVNTVGKGLQQAEQLNIDNLSSPKSGLAGDLTSGQRPTTIEVKADNVIDSSKKKQPKQSSLFDVEKKIPVTQKGNVQELEKKDLGTYTTQKDEKITRSKEQLELDFKNTIEQTAKVIGKEVKNSNIKGKQDQNQKVVEKQTTVVKEQPKQDIQSNKFVKSVENKSTATLDKNVTHQITKGLDDIKKGTQEVKSYNNLKDKKVLESLTSSVVGGLVAKGTLGGNKDEVVLNNKSLEKLSTIFKTVNDTQQSKSKNSDIDLSTKLIIQSLDSLKGTITENRRISQKQLENLITSQIKEGRISTEKLVQQSNEDTQKIVNTNKVLHSDTIRESKENTEDLKKQTHKDLSDLSKVNQSLHREAVKEGYKNTEELKKQSSINTKTLKDTTKRQTNDTVETLKQLDENNERFSKGVESRIVEQAKSSDYKKEVLENKKTAELIEEQRKIKKDILKEEMKTREEQKANSKQQIKGLNNIAKKIK